MLSTRYSAFGVCKRRSPFKIRIFFIVLGQGTANYAPFQRCLLNVRFIFHAASWVFPNDDTSPYAQLGLALRLLGKGISMAVGDVMGTAYHSRVWGSKWGR